MGPAHLERGAFSLLDLLRSAFGAGRAKTSSPAFASGESRRGTIEQDVQVGITDICSALIKAREEAVTTHLMI